MYLKFIECSHTQPVTPNVILKRFNNSSSSHKGKYDPASVLASIRKIYQTLRRVFEHIDKQLEARCFKMWKYDPCFGLGSEVRSSFISSQRLKCDQIRS